MYEISTSIGTRSEELVDIIDVSGLASSSSAGEGDNEPASYQVYLDTEPSNTDLGDVLTDAIGNTFLIRELDGDRLEVIDFGQTGEAPVGYYNLSSSSSSGSGHGSPCSTARAYSTITAWEADLTNALIYASDYTAKGLMYNDSVFDETVTLQGSTSETTILTVPESERHDGTEGTGARIVRTGTNVVFDLYIVDLVTEWFEVDCNGNQCPFIFRHSGVAGQVTKINNMIMHGISGAATSLDVISNNGDRDMTVLNNIMYDCVQTGAANLPAYMIKASQTGPSLVANNTIYKLENDNGTGLCYGIYAANDADLELKNNIVMDTGGTTTGTKKDFYFPGSTQDSDYNMSSDDSADDDGSSNSLINKVADDQFVSIVGGAEDLHLKEGADAIGAGVDLGATNGTNIDIDGLDRDLSSSIVWDMGAAQYLFTVSIGTDNRDYSTITAFESNLSYYADKVVVGECYNDSEFDEQVTFNDNTPSTVTLTVASGERHDGTAGTGVINNISSNGSDIIVLSNSTACDVTINGLEITTSTAKVHPGNRTVAVNCDIGGGGEYRRVNDCLIHGMHNSHNGGTGTPTGIRGAANNREYIFLNNIIYDLSTNGTAVSGVAGITFGSTGSTAYCQNNTVYKGSVNYASATGNCYGMTCNDNANANMQNNIVMDFDTNAGSGAAADFETSSYSSATVDHNLSSDATASGTGSLTSKTAENQFVSIVEGAEDLHLKLGSDAAGAGADLGDTNDVNIDIDSIDREYFNPERWSIGAHEGPQEIIKTIGTDGRDYSTVVAFEADLGDDTLYHTGDHVIGELYNDSTFTAGATFSATTVALSKVTLRAADSDRHDGTAGTGARIEEDTDRILYLTTMGTDADFEVSDIEVYGTGSGSSRHIQFNMGHLVGEVRRCIIHGGTHSAAGTRALIVVSGRYKTITDNILYDFQMTTGDDAHGIHCDNLLVNLYNNTVDNITALDGNTGYGITTTNDHATTIVKNNAVTRCDQDIEETAPVSADYNYNATSDSSASGGNSLTGITAEDQYVSIVGGSEDYKLVSDADLIGAALDLTTTSDANYDIIKQDRDAFDATAWDIGAHQYALIASIGTDSRDYSTIAAWESGLSSDSIYGPVRGIALGECYNDSEFDEIVAINDSNPDSIVLTAADGEQHDGTAGTGARIVRTGGGNILELGVDIEVTDLEFDCNSQLVPFTIRHTSGGYMYSKLKRLIMHGASGAATAMEPVSNGGGRQMDMVNCMIYDYTQTAVGTYNLKMMNFSQTYVSLIANNVIYKARNNSVDGVSYGASIGNQSNMTVKNNIVVDIGGTTSGAKKGFVFAGSNPDTDYNLSSDDTADDDGSTHSIIDAVTEDQFVSIVDGAEDLHLKEGADAIGAGIDLGTTNDVNIDIDSFNRDIADSIIWDMGASQYLCTLSIGTDGREYSTITAFESDLSSYADKVVVGECYNDSDFDENVTINDSTPAKIILTVAEEDRHDGTAGTGARIVSSSSGNNVIVLGTDNTADTVLSWLELTTSLAKVNPNYLIAGVGTDVGGGGEHREVRRCIIHGFHNSSNGGTGTPTGIGGGENNREYIFQNNIIYDLESSANANAGVRGIAFGATFTAAYCQNNTIYKGRISGAGNSKSCYGMTCNDNANAHMQNNIVCGFTTNGTGSAADFETTSYSSATVDHNLSSDATASGTGSLTNEAAEDQFISIVEGAEDLHLKVGSVAFNAGIDLSDDGVTIDIIGTARPQFGSFDIGAFESLIDLTPIAEYFDAFFRLL